MEYIKSGDIKVFPSYWRNAIADEHNTIYTYDLDSGETSEKSLTKLNSENKSYVVSYDNGTFEIVVCGYYFEFSVPSKLLSSNDLTALVKVKDNVLIPYTDNTASNLDVIDDTTHEVKFRGLALSTDANPEITENVYSLKIWNHTTNSVPKESWFKYKSRDIEVGTHKELGEVVDLVEDVIRDNGDIKAKGNNDIGTINKPFNRIYAKDIELSNQEGTLAFKDIKVKSVNNTTDSWYVDENGNAKFNNISTTFLDGNSRTTNGLKTPINLGVDLSKTSSTSFNGSESVTDIGISGILKVANGGLGTDLTNSTGILYHNQGSLSVTTLTLSNEKGNGDIYTVNKVDSLLSTNLSAAKNYTDAKLTKYEPSVPGKHLSTNDFTNDYLNKLNSLKNYVLPPANTNTLGGVKLGYESTNTLNLALQLDNNDRAYVQIDPSAFISNSGDSTTTAASCSWTYQLAVQVSTNKTDIANLKTDVNNLKTDVNSLKTNVANIKVDINNLKAKDTSIDGEINSLKTNVTGLQTNVNKLLSGAPTRFIYSELKTDSNGYITDRHLATTIFNMLYDHNRIVTAWQCHEEGDDISYYNYTQLLIEGNGTSISDGIHVVDLYGHPFTNEDNITIMIVKLEGLS